MSNAIPSARKKIKFAANGIRANPRREQTTALVKDRAAPKVNDVRFRPTVACAGSELTVAPVRRI